MESAIQEAPIDAVPDAAGKPSKLPLLLVVAGGLIVGGGVGAFLTGPMIAAKFRGKAAAPAAASGVKTEHGKSADGKSADGKGADGKGADGGDQKVLRVIDNLVLNPAGSGGTRFLMVTATFEVADAKTDEALKARDAQVRDALLAYLGRKTVAELTDMGNRDQIKKELLTLVAPLVPEGKIRAVYFPQFVIQ